MGGPGAALGEALDEAVPEEYHELVSTTGGVEGERSMRARAGLVGILVAAGLLAPGGAQAAPVTLTCGQVVTQDVVLAADVSCGPSNSPGLVVGADGITIDLNGHSVSAWIFAGHTGGTGIVNEGHDGVTIRNGSVGGAIGISLEGASANRVVGVGAGGFIGIYISGGSGNIVRDSSADFGFTGIQVVGSPRTAILGNRLGGTDFGLSLDAGSSSSVVQGNNALRSYDNTHLQHDGIGVAGSSNLIVGNGASTIEVAGGTGNVVVANVVVRSLKDSPNDADGIHVASGSANTAVVRNIAAANTDGDGIDVDTASARLVNNVAVNNGDYGIEAVPGVSASGNRASGNGNPAQCLNVVCQ